jgi:hypothetical protein
MNIGFLLATLFGTAFCGYNAYLAWFKPTDFARMYENSPFVSDSFKVNDWINSSGHLWLARIGSLLFATICGFFFFMSIIAYIF